jgi:hypothetical protein
LLLGVALGVFGVAALAFYLVYMLAHQRIEDVGVWAQPLMYFAFGCVYASPVCLLVALVTLIVSFFVSNGPVEGWDEPVA